MNIKYIIFTLTFFAISLNVVSEELIKAVEEGDTTLVETLLKNKRDMNIRNEQGRDLISIALEGIIHKQGTEKTFQPMTLPEYKKIITMLIDAGADVNATSSLKGVGEVGVIHRSIYTLDPELVQLLIDRGADVNLQAKNKYGLAGDNLTPLHSIVFGLCMITFFADQQNEDLKNYYDKMFQIVQRLIDAGASKNSIIIHPKNKDKKFTPVALLQDCMQNMTQEQKAMLQRFIDLLKE